MADAADFVAQARREAGLSRQLQVVRRESPHPSRGGSTGFEEWYRDEQLDRRANGEECDASRSSVYRWGLRRERFRRTGNRERNSVVGIDMLNLVCFVIAHPDATLDEIAVHLYNEGGDLYSIQVLSKRLKELRITKKKASTEAYQALTPANRFRAFTFWNCPPPLGVKGVPRNTLIDADEFGLTLEKCNRTGGWALMCHRVRKDGDYKRGLKITCLLAIEAGDPRLPAHMRGSIDNPRRWVRCIQSGGTTTIVFRDFVDMICRSIEADPIMGFHDAAGNHVVTNTDAHRLLIWDNLTSHHAAYVTQTVVGRPGPCRFSIVPRPPYMPKYGPIEYKICDLTHVIRLRKSTSWDMAKLEREIYRAARDIGPFDSTFDHCGYKWKL